MSLTRKRIIYDRSDEEPYMIRYHLLFREKSEHLEKNVDVPFNLYLHKILLSDEPTFHDHPWPWATFIISGGYYEHTPKGTLWRGPGSWRIKKSTDLHWLELKKNKPCWTLFWRGTRHRIWGFQTLSGWTDYRTFLKNEEKTQAENSIHKLQNHYR